MRKLLFITAAFFTALVLFAFTRYQRQHFNTRIFYLNKSAVIHCTPNWKLLLPLIDESNIPLLPGAGTYTWKISTKNDSAQAYFNQGMNTYYGFHTIEALASFKKAARFDSTNAMVWWGQALAYGPNINDNGYAMVPDAVTAVNKALSFSTNASSEEKALIKAMSVRYSIDSTISRAVLNQAYADAMKATYQQYKNKPDVGALYADALMVQHPWNLWNNDGTPKEWTPLIEQVLEDVLAKAPMHPGANHYYIHTMEASPYAYKATASADRLPGLTPGLSHMVHMPSHIYLRTGNFNKAIDLNTDAVKQFQQYISLFPDVQANPFLYSLHNLHMKANCAMLAGRYADAIDAGTALKANIDSASLSLPAPLGYVIQLVYMVNMFADVRFQKWDSLLLMEKPDPRHLYQTILYHFGRGMAYAAKGQSNLADQEQAQLQALTSDESLKLAFATSSPFTEDVKVANEMLLGAIAKSKNDLPAAIAHFKTAAETEENMNYGEPRDWFLNPKQYLGAIYLQAHQWKNAEDAFNRDMKVNALNVWSLKGLSQALQAQKKTKELAVVKKQLQQASVKSDMVSL